MYCFLQMKCIGRTVEQDVFRWLVTDREKHKKKHRHQHRYSNLQYDKGPKENKKTSRARSNQRKKITFTELFRCTI